MTDRGYCGVGLHLSKNLFNVGSAMRACHCFDARFMAISGKRYSPQATDTTSAFKHMPFFQVDDLRNIIPYDCVPVGVDLVDRAVPLENYVHPERAFYIFGPEDGTLGGDLLASCRDVLKINSRDCLNLAAAVNVVLYDRQAKRRQPTLP